MLEVLNLALNNEYIYIGVIAVLVIIIIITILSIRKDYTKKKPVVKEVEPEVKPAESKEEQQKARMELEKVVNTMKNDLDNKPVAKDEIKTYEQEQEQKAIISYQELVDAVKKNSQNEETTAQTTPGMEVADDKVIEPVEDKEIKAVADQLTSIFDDQVIEPTDVPVYQETSIEEHVDEEVPHTTVEQTTIYREEPVNLDNIDLSSNANTDISTPIDEPSVVEIPKEEPKKFQSSEFISPVYGRQNVGVSEQPVAPKEEVPEMKHASIDDIIDDEMDSNEEFLENLKKFRNNL